MRGALWWIDRWRQSQAFTDMTAEEQGLYRNLCDELWLREDHVIPDDARILARVSGDPEAWARCGKKVLKWMRKTGSGWTNDTALEVIEQSKKRAARQAAFRERSGNPVAKTDAERRAKDAARSAVARAIASGRLVRGPCAHCGALEVQAHHEDYDQPLVVVWLCKQHHDHLHNTRVASGVTRTDATNPYNVPASPFTVTGSVSVTGTGTDKASGADAPAASFQTPAENAERERTKTEAMASSNPAREEYVRQVWAAWCTKRGGQLPEPTPAELDLARALDVDGVPLRIALRAIKDCSKPPRGPRTPLQYVEPAFHDAARHWRRSQTA